MSKNIIVPMFSYSFKVYSLTFKSFIHFTFIFCICCEKVVQIHSFARSCTVFPVTSIENAVFSPFYVLASLTQINWPHERGFPAERSALFR